MNHAERIARVRKQMERADVDVLLLSSGPDLPYLIGYEAMPLERLTMLVLAREGTPRLVIPELEAPRVPEAALRGADAIELVTWAETEDPIAITATLVGSGSTLAVGDHTWARFVLLLQQQLADRRFVAASTVTAPVRRVKDHDEIAALQRAATGVDEVAAAMRARPFAGRAEIEVHRELVDRMLEVGHVRANFAIVACGANAASPHHEPGPRVIADGDIVLCDFGGTMDGYCSDITRMFHVGTPSSEIVDAYDVLVAAEEAGVRAGVVGAPCSSVDDAARSVITAAGLGKWFVHRTGHGIGTEAHEEPYMVSGNATPIAPGHAYSVEPGIYVAGRYGMRLEDIVVATADGPRRLNDAPRDLALVG